VSGPPPRFGPARGYWYDPDTAGDWEAESQSGYVRVHADSFASGIWDSDGVATDPQHLPNIPTTLVARIWEWQGWHDDILDRYDRPPDPRVWGVEPGFVEEGLAIAHAVKDALPDWTVEYVDVRKAYYSYTYIHADDYARCCYEIVPGRMPCNLP